MKRVLIMIPAALAFLGLACEPEGPIDCSLGSGAASVTPGYTGIAVCDEGGTCQTFDKSCESDDECFEALGQGPATTIPTWTRPQGGLGTRINVRLEGVPASNNQTDYASLRSLFIREFEDGGGGARVSCVVDDCVCSRSPAEGPCTREDVPDCACNVEQEFECARDVPEDGNVCAVVVGDQLNRQFPLVCSTDGTVHIEEMPIQFRSRWRDLDELDGVEVTVMSVLEQEDGTLVSGSGTVTLDSGEFLPPSWFDLGAPQPR
jgi:hypothetical protein